MASVPGSEGRAGRAAGWSRSYLRTHVRQFASFAVIGIISTLAFVVLYAAARAFVGPLVANFVALTLTMLFNFAANRAYTFRARDGRWAVQGGQYLVAYLLGLGGSSGVLWASLELVSEPPRTVETLIAVAAGGVATVIRFVLLSAWVFRARTVNVPEAVA